MPSIAIITVNLNNAAGLARTLSSVASQSVLPEVIVIDGGSSDGSIQIVEQNSSLLTYWLSEKDGGIYDAMNKGIAQANADFLLFLNSGDFLLDSTVVESIQPFLSADVVSGDLIIHDAGKDFFIQSDDMISVSSFQRISLHHQATFIKRSLFLQYGLYDPSFRIAGDMEFFIRVLLRHGASYLHAPVKVCHYAADGISNDLTQRDLNASERRVAWEKNFSGRVLSALDELDGFKRSEFSWIVRRTQRKGFFYYFFGFWNFIFLGGMRVMHRMKQK